LSLHLVEPEQPQQLASYLMALKVKSGADLLAPGTLSKQSSFSNAKSHWSYMITSTTMALGTLGALGAT